MTIDNTWKLDAIHIDPAGLNVLLTQVEQRTIAAELQEFVGRPAGAPNVHFRAIMTIEGKITFSSTQVKTLLGLFGNNGGICDLPADVYFKKAQCVGSDRTAAVHKKLTAQESILSWESMELPNSDSNSVASMSCTFAPVFDGTNPLYTVSNNVACPGVLGFDEAYVMGPLWLKTAGTDMGLVNGTQKVTINNNPQYKAKFAGGEARPSAAHVESFEPMIDVETLSAVNYFTIPEDGLCLDDTAGGMLLFAQRVEPCKTGSL